MYPTTDELVSRSAEVIGTLVSLLETGARPVDPATLG